MKKSVFSILYGLSATAVLLGALMKIMHFEGAMILLASGFIVGSIISIVYSYFETRRIKTLEAQCGDKNKEPKSLKKSLIAILFFFSTVAVLVGAYMVIFHINGAYILMGVGFVVGTVISSIDNKMKTKRIKELEAQLKAKGE